MKIGYFSGSTPITALSPQRFQRAKTFLRQRGVQLIAGKLTGKADGYRSGSIQERADEINTLIHEDTIDVIMATIGGTVTSSVLPYLDYSYLAQHPKTIVGYSDATALLLAIQTQAPSCRVIYGPALVASLGDWSPYVEQTWAYFKQIVTATGPVTVTAPKTWTDEQANWETFDHPKQQHANAWHYIGESMLSGRLIGGNLDTMYGFFKSDYFPKLTTDDILFIEDAEKDAATVEKNFSMLKLAGVFDQVKGIILGKHACFDPAGTDRRPIDILQEVLGSQQLPIIYDYDSCHTIPMISTPLGSQVAVDALKQTITFSDF